MKSLYVLGQTILGIFALMVAISAMWGVLAGVGKLVSWATISMGLPLSMWAMDGCLFGKPSASPSLLHIGVSFLLTSTIIVTVLLFLLLMANSGKVVGVEDRMKQG